MLDELTSEQVSEWMAYDSIDPIGKYRDEYGWAKVCSVLTNLVTDIYSKKGSHPKHTTPSDFIPEWGPQKKGIRKVQSIKEQKEILLRLARIHNSKIERQKNG